MKPKSINQEDPINALLQDTWEELPHELEQLLMEIPTQVKVERSSRLDRMLGLLHGVLLVWGLGISLYFWRPLTRLVDLFSSQSQGWGFYAVELVSHPSFIFLVVACISFTIIWLDSENREWG